MNLTQRIDETISPVTGAISDVVFFPINVAGLDVPVVVFGLSPRDSFSPGISGFRTCAGSVWP